MAEKQLTLRMILVLVLAAFLASESAVLFVSGRYLPTRSQDDKIERLRELLKELLESQSTRTQGQDVNYDQEGALGVGGSSSLVGLGSGSGSSGRSLLFKRDIAAAQRSHPSRGPFKGQGSPSL